MAYINTTSALKTECDVCVTSSSAVNICRALDADKILFIPDPEPWQLCGCAAARKAVCVLPRRLPAAYDCFGGRCGPGARRHPDAELLVHPECRAEVVAQADYVGSTTGIMAYAKNPPRGSLSSAPRTASWSISPSTARTKSFYPLAVQLTCMNMKLTTLPDIYRCLLGTGGEQITLPDDIMAGAGRCIRRMVELGG